MFNDPNQFLYESTKILMTAIGEVVSEESIRGLQKQVKNLLTKHSVLVKSENEDAAITAMALHRMRKEGTLPQIALVGMTSAGKSSLVNALFGSPLSDVKVTTDTTKVVLRIEYRSGLIIYDTPGLFGDDTRPYHNITRLFLRLKQDSEYASAVDIPFQYDASKLSSVDHIAPDNIKRHAPITAALWVVNASRPLLSPEKKAFRTFFEDLETYYKGCLVVVGTHLDALRKVSFDEGAEMLRQWESVTNDQLIPVSSVNGEGLDSLVRALFSSLPDNTSLAKLQESLVVARKLNRLSFALTEVSKILTSIILLDGTYQDEIKIASIAMFTIVCDHYSVDEETWRRYSGDAIQIGREVQSVGTYEVKKLRNPRGLFERIKFVLGMGLFETVTKFRKLGVDGLEKLLPKVYLTVYDFEGGLTAAYSEENIRQMIQIEKPSLELLIEKDDRGRLAIKINELLMSLFDTL